MKKVLYERRYRVNLNAPALQKKYLMGLVAQLNNETVDPANSPGERNRAYQNIIAAMKVLADIEKNETLKDLDDRLTKVESERGR
jgi:hypothetical protein